MQTSKKSVSILSILLYGGAGIVAVAAVVILVYSLSFGTSLSYALMPLQMAGMSPLINAFVPVLAQGVANLGILIFVVLLALVILLLAAAQMAARSVSLEARVRYLEEWIARQN